MKAKLAILITITILIVSCRKQLTAPETEVPMKVLVNSVSIEQEPLATDTPMLSAMLQGNWLVETMDTEKYWTTLGILIVNGNSYRFHSTSDVEIPAWARERFCFFEKPTGEAKFEYKLNVSPTDDVRSFENHYALLRWTGIGCKEAFLVHVNQENQELYLHAQVSEIQLYQIHKSYAK